MSGDTVIAHHSYEAQQDDELSFEAGDIIAVLDHSNTDWWQGKKQDGSLGYFPSNFVDVSIDKEQIQHETPSSTAMEEKAAANPGMVRVMEDYAMQESDELTLHKGTIVEVKERLDDGWCLGEVNGKIGRFHTKYIEEIDIPSGSVTVTSNTVVPSDSHVHGGFKLAAFGVKQGGIGSLLAGGIPPLKKTSSASAEKPVTNEPTAKVSEGALPVVRNTPDAILLEAKISYRAIVLHDYDPENGDELNLVRGEYIDVLECQVDGGWVKGRNERKETGVFPKNFVMQVDQSSTVAPARVRSSIDYGADNHPQMEPDTKSDMPMQCHVPAKCESTQMGHGSPDEGQSPKVESMHLEKNLVQTVPICLPLPDDEGVPCEETDGNGIPDSQELALECDGPIEQAMSSSNEPASVALIAGETAAANDDSEEKQDNSRTEEEMPQKVDLEVGNIETNDTMNLSNMMPASGPRLSSPARITRPSRASPVRRPSSKKEIEPSQSDLLQLEVKKVQDTSTTEALAEALVPASPPPKPVKPIFAKFPTPFAGRGAEISTKSLKPVQRRMFEPAPAHEPILTEDKKEEDNTLCRPAGVRGLASRFAGVPTSSGNEVLETKLRNFTKNEIDKMKRDFEKQLEVERIQREQLQELVTSLVKRIDALQSQTQE